MAQPAPAAAATVSIGCPSTAPLMGDSFVSEISVDTGSVPLGAYTFTIT
jgi:hypothetical protein